MQRSVCVWAVSDTLSNSQRVFALRVLQELAGADLALIPTVPAGWPNAAPYNLYRPDQPGATEIAAGIHAMAH